MAEQDDDAELAAKFSAAAAQLAEQEATIIDELNDAQGAAVDIGGYYRPDEEITARAMRPSPKLNAIIDAM